MRILGIDPGIAITGFSIIDRVEGEYELIDCGVIRTPSDLPLPERLVILQKDLQAVIEQYEGISVSGVEELFFAKNVKTAFSVGQARGVILFTLAQHGITIIEVKPVEVKSTITGSGNADKKEVQKMVMLTFGLKEVPQPDDAADAVAVGITAAQFHLQNESQK